MRLFFGALVFNFMLFLNKIEVATSMKRVFVKSSDSNKNNIDALATSRVGRHSSSTYDPSSIAHALDLSGHHYNSPESSHQQGSIERLDIEKKVKRRYAHSSKVDLFTQKIPNNQIQDQQQEYLRQGDIAWIQHQQPNGEYVNIPMKMPLQELSRRRTTEEKEEIREKTEEARRVYRLKLKDQSQLLHAREQEPDQDSRAEENLKLIYKYFPQGLSDIKSYPYTLSTKPPPALHEIDPTISKSGYRRRPNKAEREAKQKGVLDSHDQPSQHSQPQEPASQDYQYSQISQLPEHGSHDYRFSQQSQLSDQAYQDHQFSQQSQSAKHVAQDHRFSQKSQLSEHAYPTYGNSQQSQLSGDFYQHDKLELIDNDMSRYNNPYLEFHRPNPYGIPNPYYYSDHPGGQGSG